MEVYGTEPRETLSLFEILLDILEKPLYSNSASNIEHLLTMIEGIVAPISHLPKYGDLDVELNSRVCKDLL